MHATGLCMRLFEATTCQGWQKYKIGTIVVSEIFSIMLLFTLFIQEATLWKLIASTLQYAHSAHERVTIRRYITTN